MIRPGEGKVGGASACPAQVPADSFLVGVVLAAERELFESSRPAVLGEPFEYLIPQVAGLVQVIRAEHTKLR